MANKKKRGTDEVPPEEIHGPVEQRFKRKLMCALTDEEANERLVKAHELDKRLEQKAEQKKVSAEGYTLEIKVLEARRAALKKAFDAKEEEREIECEVRYNFDTGMKETWRLDTIEHLVHLDTKLTEAERQRDLFGKTMVATGESEERATPEGTRKCELDKAKVWWLIEFTDGELEAQFGPICIALGGYGINEHTKPEEPVEWHSAVRPHPILDALNGKAGDDKYAAIIRYLEEPGTVGDIADIYDEAYDLVSDLDSRRKHAMSRLNDAVAQHASPLRIAEDVAVMRALNLVAGKRSLPQYDLPTLPPLVADEAPTAKATKAPKLAAVPNRDGSRPAKGSKHGTKVVPNQRTRKASRGKDAGA